ncbi:mitochondrial ATP synthase epsilon chain-domain-containing protein [Polychytrium aggregatum]|uniref:mitochondrial ATP synthase epsilon chain-domain-containing protein n=1 Tax=Polychytrium aggregatum TaxID=110093 RepID=UPI0022FED29C|nr:mitochondrial ATP synthase epsilon chain-domain-containing protein [Polychytrium aggregatum]KAI9203676.1 mitochondrial ATP synthase epsilon chain-domain-containing protein [Polychytrium aggregatum]
MPFAFREVGLSYLQYVSIASRTLRSVLKAEPKAAAIKRQDQIAKYAQWSAGKQGESKFVLPEEIPRV